jgi:D-tyrosyl-tRNA(Tyr) deacylase
MRAVLQRVLNADISVDGTTVSSIGRGLLVLLCAMKGDSKSDVEKLADKCINLRIFEDDSGKMNLSVCDMGGEVAVVSQFTLAANCKKGRRPSFEDAMAPDEANHLCEYFCEYLADLSIPTRSGKFAAHMKVSLTNDGPVTIVLDSRDL